MNLIEYVLIIGCAVMYKYICDSSFILSIYEICAITATFILYKSATVFNVVSGVVVGFLTLSVAVINDLVKNKENEQ